MQKTNIKHSIKLLIVIMLQGVWIEVPTARGPRLNRATSPDNHTAFGLVIGEWAGTVGRKWAGHGHGSGCGQKI